jgi:hypothetical protein
MPAASSDIRIKALIPFLQKYIPGNPPHRPSRLKQNPIFTKRSRD